VNIYYQEVALILTAYAFGCISTGYYLVRVRTGDDVRRLESGNVGARNVGRVLGVRALVITLLGDTAKGAIPVVLARLMGLEQWAVLAVGFAVVVGHVWPAQLGFRGGKGLATTMGAVIALDFTLVLAAFVIAGIAWLASRNVTASGLIGAALTPLIAALTGHPQINVIGLVIFAAMIMFTHRWNLRAMIAKRVKPSRRVYD
jgi:glycerol-3-phosphate acyltransferase PlsY